MEAITKEEKEKKNCTKRRRRQKKKILDVSAATKTAVVVVLTGVEGFSLTMQVEVKQPSPHQVSYHFSFITSDFWFFSPRFEMNEGEDRMELLMPP